MQKRCGLPANTSVAEGVLGATRPSTCPERWQAIFLGRIEAITADERNDLMHPEGLRSRRAATGTSHKAFEK